MDKELLEFKKEFQQLEKVKTTFTLKIDVDLEWGDGFECFAEIDQNSMDEKLDKQLNKLIKEQHKKYKLLYKKVSDFAKQNNQKPQDVFDIVCGVKA